MCNSFFFLSYKINKADFMLPIKILKYLIFLIFIICKFYFYKMNKINAQFVSNETLDAVLE